MVVEYGDERRFQGGRGWGDNMHSKRGRAQKVKVDTGEMEALLKRPS